MSNLKKRKSKDNFLRNVENCTTRMNSIMPKKRSRRMKRKKEGHGNQTAMLTPISKIIDRLISHIYPFIL